MELHLFHQNRTRRLKQFTIALAIVAICVQCSSNLRPIVIIQLADPTKSLDENHRLTVTAVNAGLYQWQEEDNLNVLTTNKAMVTENTNALNENVRSNNKVFRTDNRADCCQPNRFPRRNLHVRVHRF